MLWGYFVLKCKYNQNQRITVIRESSQRWKSTSASFNNEKPHGCSRRSPHPLHGFFLTVPAVLFFACSSSLSLGGSDWNQIKPAEKEYTCAHRRLLQAACHQHVCVCVYGSLGSTGLWKEYQHLLLFFAPQLSQAHIFWSVSFVNKLFVTPGDKYNHKDGEIKKQHKECIND